MMSHRLHGFFVMLFVAGVLVTAGCDKKVVDSTGKENQWYPTNFIQQTITFDDNSTLVIVRTRDNMEPVGKGKRVIVYQDGCNFYFKFYYPDVEKSHGR